LEAALQGAGFPIYPISAATGEGVGPLMEAVGAALRAIEPAAITEKPQERRRYTLASQDERAWQVERRSAHHFGVSGIGIERFTKMTDFSSEQSVERFQRVLDTSGISAELERLGIQEGDTVHLAGREFTWGDQAAFLDEGATTARPRGRQRSRQNLAAELDLEIDELAEV
jgi:GTP-binding protein